MRHGPSANRVDVVIMGEGYEIDHQKAFEKLAENIPDYFARQNTFGEYFEYFNFLRANLVSAQSGVDGRLWLREWTLDTLSSQWLILDSAGSPEGRLHAPSGFRLLAADSASVFGVLKDELDVETVIRGSVRASAPGGVRAP